MSYEQAIKHWSNHRKDRFFQQCSGYAGDGIPSGARMTPEQEEALSRKTMTEILTQDLGFPIYLAQDNIGRWMIVPKNHISGVEIKDPEALKAFAFEYAGVGDSQ